MLQYLKLVFIIYLLINEFNYIRNVPQNIFIDFSKCIINTTDRI